MNSSKEYNEYFKVVFSEIVALVRDLPDKKKRAYSRRISDSLNMSQANIYNYFNGFGTNPPTALDIRSKLKELMCMGNAVFSEEGA